MRIEIDGRSDPDARRHDSFNAMSRRCSAKMTVRLSWLATGRGLRALIVTGAGKAFSAGGDVNWFRKGVEDEEIDLPSEVRRGAEALHQAITDLRRIPYPVLAAINGPAAGAGFSLALACDTRIASDAAFLACAYGRIGASPDGGMTYFLPRVVGPSRALELLLEDPNIDAERALAEGLVREVVPAEELMERARAKAEKLAAMAPHYVRMAKRLCGVSIENSLTDHLQLERHGIADSMATEDLREGAVAFFSGQEPEFKGR
jgi:enoyl-CoA hydratase/carnithine racemase